MRTLARTGAVGLAAALAAATLGTAPAQAGTAVPAAQGGRIEVWGAGSADPAPIRVTYDAQRYVAVASGGLNDAVTLGVTAAGDLEVLAGSGPLATIPASQAGKDVEGVVMNTSAVVVWNTDGSVASWSARGTGINVAGVTGHVEEAVLGSGFALFRKDDGTVQSAGTNISGADLVPDELTSTSAPGFKPVTDISGPGSGGFGVAVRSDGSVVAWGEEVSVPVPNDLGQVEHVASNKYGTVTLDAAGALRFFGNRADFATVTPASAPAGTGRFVSVAASEETFAALTDTGHVEVWTDQPTETTTPLLDVPAALQDQARTASLTGGGRQYQLVVTEDQVVEPLAVTAKGTITGTPKVGQALTGTAATFNDATATVARQWLVGGEPVEGATGATFTPTAAHVGKPVALRTTATRGDDSLEDVSAATADVAPATPTPPAKAATSVVLSGSTSVRYGTLVRWTVTVRGGTPAGGTVTVAGSGVSTRATVSRGRAVVTLPRTLNPASRTLRVTYGGDATHLGSYRNATFRVVKANASASARVTKRPTSRKAGKVRVTVRGSGPARATGRVTVTIQKGRTRYTVRGTVRSNGTVDLTLRKLKKGTWTVKAVYAGDTRYNSRATGAVRVKVSK